MNIVALMILAPLRALIINLVSGAWLFGFLEDPQQPNGAYSTGHGSSMFLLCAMATLSVAIAGVYLYWGRYRRNRGRV